MDNSKYIDEYQVKKEIGQNKYHKVYKAIDKNNQEVAIKVYTSENITSQFLQRQIKILKSIDHQHIAELKDFRKSASITEQGEKPIIVRQYIKGLNLTDYLSITGKFTQNEARYFVTDIINILYEAHENQYAPIRIRSQNIFINQSYILKFTDLQLDIEKIQNKIIDSIKADILQLGKILFLLVAGRPPFMSNSCRLYGFISEKRYRNFWQAHSKKGQRNFSSQFQEFFIKLVSPTKQKLTIKDICKEDWMSKAIPPTFNEIKDQISRRNDRIRNQQLKKMIESKKSLQKKDSFGSRRSDQVVDKEFQQHKNEQLKKQRLLKTTQYTGKYGFFITQKLTYAIPTLKVFLKNLKIQLQVNQDFIQNVPKYQFKSLQEKANEIFVTYQNLIELPEDEQNQETQIIEILKVKILVCQNRQNYIGFSLLLEEGEQFYYRKLAHAIKSQFLCCLVQN